MYNTAQNFQFLDRGARVLVVRANGGTVSVQCHAGGSNWVTSDTYDADIATEMFFGLALFRIVPAGGAEYDVL